MCLLATALYHNLSMPEITKNKAHQIQPDKLQYPGIILFLGQLISPPIQM